MPSPETSSPRSPPPFRAGLVAITGRPNVGKSTLLNAVVGEPLAIVTPTPQTTRTRLLAVAHRPEGQIGFLDTPGLHRPRSRLGRAMNRAARAAVGAADVVLFLTDVPARPAGELRPHPGDLTLLEDLGAGAPTVLAVNKCDRLRRKELLLPLLDALKSARPFRAVVPISARTGDGVERLLQELFSLLPVRDALFDPDVLTDRPLRCFAAEFVREQVLLGARQEVPHAAAVEIERFEERDGEVHVRAVIHVEREGQRRILLGAGGARLKHIGIAARKRTEALVGGRVHLGLWVRVTPGWTESPERLRELGYDGEERP